MKNMLIRTSASAQRAAPASVSGHQPTSATGHQPAGRRCLRAAKRLLVSRCISAKSRGVCTRKNVVSAHIDTRFYAYDQ